MIAEGLNALVLLAQFVSLLFLMYGALVVYITLIGESNMELSKSRTHQDQSQAVLRAVAARTAILIGVLSAIFYIALTTTTDPLAALNSVDTAQPDPAPPALQESQAAVQGQPAPQRVPGHFPDGYAYQVKSEDGNVITYAHE